MGNTVASAKRKCFGRPWEYLTRRPRSREERIPVLCVLLRHCEAKPWQSHRTRIEKSLPEKCRRTVFGQFADILRHPRMRLPRFARNDGVWGRPSHLHMYTNQERGTNPSAVQKWANSRNEWLALFQSYMLQSTQTWRVWQLELVLLHASPRGLVRVCALLPPSRSLRSRRGAA